MLFSLLLLAAEPVEDEPDCSYNLEEMLTLDQQAFDQDIKGGWRELQARGCSAEAAELIREWRHEKRNHAGILYTHEGQMRAYAGQYEEAAALLKLTYKPMDLDADFGWNFYVDGTIAFLARDRSRLEKAIERLSAIPKPSIEMVRSDGRPAEIRWPPNLHVLKAFERCWEKSYAEAYGTRECHSLPPEEEG